jgi:WXG100 family type VII secretion target
MANAAKIQADYAQLRQIAGQFAQHGDRTLSLGRQVYGCMSQLADGGWLGVGANRFYAEMNDQVLPALERLMNALNTGGAQTERVAQLLAAAEEEAGRLFFGGEAGNAGAPSGVSAETIGTLIGGIFGGSAGAAIGGAIGRAIGNGTLSGSLGLNVTPGGKPFFPLKMFKNYIGRSPVEYVGADGKIYKREFKFGSEFGKRHLFGEYKDGADKKFINRNVDGKIVLAGGDLWHEKGAVLRGDLQFQSGGFKGGAFGEVLSYDTAAKWEAAIGRDGVKVGASGYAGAYLARIGATAEYGGLQAAGQAYVGAQVQGEIGAVLRPGQAYVGAGGEAFIGGKAEGNVKYTHQVMDGLKVSGGVGGYVSYGAGVQADFKAGYDDGKIKFGGALGATWGVGAGVKFDFTVDAKGLVDKGVQSIESAGRNIVDFGRGAVDIARFLF